MNCSRKRCKREATPDSSPDSPMCVEHHRKSLRMTGTFVPPRRARLKPAAPGKQPCGRCGAALSKGERSDRAYIVFEDGRAVLVIPDPEGRLGSPEGAYNAYQYQVGADIKLLCPACWKAVTT